MAAAGVAISLSVSAAGCSSAIDVEYHLHPVIRLGETLNDLRPVLDEYCRRTEQIEYTGEMAAPFTEQTQIDCADVPILGAPRKVEFLFNDGPLGHVWVHLERDEIERVHEQLQEEFGPVVYESDHDRVYSSETIALRRRPPEVLVATPSLIRDITGYTGSDP